jgi:hypothetical protein
MDRDQWLKENGKGSMCVKKEGDRLGMEENCGGSSGQQSGHGSQSYKRNNRHTIIQNSFYEILMKTPGSEHLMQPN